MHAYESHHGFAHPPRNIGALSIEPGIAVADFGSGSGAYALLIAEALAGRGQIYAIDVQRDLLRRLHNEAQKRKFDTLRIIWGDLERPGGSTLADGSLDLVLISNLLFQVEEKRILLEEAWRILRGKGRLAMIDWSDSPSAGGWRLGPEQKEVVTKEKAISLGSEVGFELDHAFEAGAHHWGVILRKRLA